VNFANLSAHSPPMAAAVVGPQKAVHDSAPHPVHEKPAQAQEVQVHKPHPLESEVKAEARRMQDG
jgi:hypothetical protein